MTHGRNAQGTVAGVVLAAGAGRRFGAPKATAHDGRWLASSVASLADAGCEPVYVTLGAATVDVPHPAIALDVIDWRSGLSESVRVGLTAAQAQSGVVGVVLTLVDLPDVTAAVVTRVQASADRSPRALARATYAGRVGHPVYIGRDHIGAVIASLAGDRGATDFLRGRSDLIEVECGDLATGHDVDFAPTGDGPTWPHEGCHLAE